MAICRCALDAPHHPAASFDVENGINPICAALAVGKRPVAKPCQDAGEAARMPELAAEFEQTGRDFFEPRRTNLPAVAPTVRNGDQS